MHVFYLWLQATKRAAIKILKNFDEAITVDIASLDPESLYQRPYAGSVLTPHLTSVHYYFPAQ